MLNMLVDIVDICSVCIVQWSCLSPRFYRPFLLGARTRRRAADGETPRNHRVARRGSVAASRRETRRYKRLGEAARASVTHSHSLELPGILHTMKGWQVGVSITVPASVSSNQCCRDLIIVTVTKCTVVLISHLLNI